MSDREPRKVAKAVVRENPCILFVNSQTRPPLREMGLPTYPQWLAAVSGLPINNINEINVADGESLPNTVSEFHGIIAGGSGRSAYEDEAWINRTGDFLNAAQAQGVPQLLICFSKQLAAEAMGGRTTPGKEGWRFGIEELTLTPEGRRDPFFDGFPTRFEMFTSHRDAVVRRPRSRPDRPVTTLASSSAYKNEALAIGDNTRTIQPHPEFTAAIESAFAEKRRKLFIAEGLVGPSDEEFKAWLERFKAKDEQIQAHGRRLVGNWLNHFVGPSMNR